MKDIENLLNAHKNNLYKIAVRFRVKHDLPYFENLSVSDSIVLFGDQYVFSWSDIFYDLSSNQPKNDIVKWYESESYIKNKVTFEQYQHGLRTVSMVKSYNRNRLKENMNKFLSYLKNYDKHK